MNPVSPVAHSPLTQSDITRLPKDAVQPKEVATQQGSQADTYESNKPSALKKTIWTIVGLAALAVAAKYLGRNSFLKFDANNMKWYDHIKKYTMVAADYIEKPFIAGYKKVLSWLPKKTA